MLDARLEGPAPTTVSTLMRVLRPAVGVVCLALFGPAAALSDEIAAGDAARGKVVYEKCGACHSPDVDRVGPHHRGVVGRQAGTVPGFDYSAELRRSQIVWNEKTLDRWLTDPQAYVPGARMFFQLEDPSERADVIAYLATLE